MNTFAKLSVSAVVLVGVSVGVAAASGDDSGPVHEPRGCADQLPALTSRDGGPAAAEPAVARTGEVAPAQGGGAYGAAPGTRLTFDYASRASTEVRMPGEQGGRNTQTCDFRGHLVIEVLDRRGDELVVAASFPDLALQATVGGAAVAADGLERAAAGMRQESLVRMRDDGMVLGFRLPDAMDPEARQQIRMLLAAPRFVVPAGLPAAWRTEETDASGVHDVRYTLAEPGDRGFTVRRQRATCRLHAHGGGTAAVATLEDVGTARFDRSIGWLTSARCETRTTADLGEGASIVAVEHTDLQLIGSEIAAARSLEGSEPWDEPVGFADTARAALLREAAADARLIGGASLDLLVQGIDEALRGAGQESNEALAAKERLAAFFRRHPWDADTVLQQLRSQLSPQTAAWVLSAAGLAGTPAAQVLLASAMQDENAPEPLRGAAVFASHQLDSPDDRVVGAVRALHAGSANDSPLRSTALLLLGTMARKRADLVPELLALEAQAAAEQMSEVFVEALRNADQRAHLERIAEHGDEGVRQRASQILQAMGKG